MAISNIFLALRLSVQFTIPPASNQKYWVNSYTLHQNEPPNLIFQNNLKNLLETLESHSSKIGFYNSSFGESPNQVHGLYLCRGDLDSQECSDCVSYVKNAILTNNKGWNNSIKAVFWYDHCMLHYANKAFVDEPDVSISNWRVHVPNPQNGTLNKMRLMKVLGATMAYVPIKAAKDESGKRFATKVTKLSRSESLYAMAQCTWDLTSCDCNMCLTKLTKRLLHMWRAPWSSGFAYSRSCMIRLETFPFFGSIPNLLSSSLPSLAMTTRSARSLSGSHSARKVLK